MDPASKVMASIGVLHQDDWSLCGVVLNDTVASDHHLVTGRLTQANIVLSKIF
jgi:hypothetical protein